MRDHLLEILWYRRGQFVSGNELADEAGISRVGVWKHLEALKNQGYPITGIRGKGYCIDDNPDVIVPRLISDKMKNSQIGRSVLYYHHLDSTNDTLKALLRSKSPAEGTVIVAGHQSGGKGRLGRKWQSPEGGLYFSILFQPRIAVADAASLSLVLAVAVCQALRKMYAIPASIKWPNDVLIKNRKLGGILLELSGEVDRADNIVAGIGINANVDCNQMPDGLQKYTTSLLEQLGSRVSINDLLTALLTTISEYYAAFCAGGFKPLKSEFLQLCAHLGQQIQVTRGRQILTGTFQDVDNAGNMMLDTAAGIEKITAGDVHLL